MAEYIDRETAINAVVKNDCEGYASWAIKSVPTADVVERKHGKWLYTPTHWAYCSCCGEEPPSESNFTTRYCPNCGAEMENYDKLI